MQRLCQFLLGKVLRAKEAVLQWFFLCFPDVLPAELLRKELHLVEMLAERPISF